MENDWIDWNGGECPVSPDTLVDVLLRVHSFIPYKFETNARAGDLYWYTDKSGYPVDKPFSPYNIVRYRLSKEPGQKPASGDAGCLSHPENAPTVPSEAHYSGDAITLQEKRLRDRFAQLAMKSALDAEGLEGCQPERIAAMAYEIADAMIAERGKKK